MPRKYKVTGPDGHTYQFDWNADTDPTSEDLDEMFGGGVPSSTPPPTMPEPNAEAPEGLFGRSADILGRAANTFSRLTGGTAVEAGIDAYQTGKPILGAIKDAYTPTGLGTFKENPSGDTILENAGYDQGLGRAVGGFALDILTDPGNLLGGTILKAPSLVGKAAEGLGATGKAVNALKNFDAVDSAVSGLKGVGKVVDHIPGLSGLKNAAENTFVVRPASRGIQSALGDVEYNDLARLYDSSGRAAGESAENLAEDMFKVNGKVMGEADRKAIAYAIDQGNLEGLSPDQLGVAQKFKTQMDYLHGEQVKLGNLTPKQKIQNYIQYLTKSGQDAEAVVAPATGSIPQSARKRQAFTTLQDAVAKGGATDDALEIAAKSTAQVERAKNKIEFLDEVMKRYQVPHGRELNFAHMNISKDMQTKFKGLKIDPRAADDIERVIKVWESPTEFDNVVKTANKLFKASVTAIIPAHHLNNFQGNIHNLYVSGMSLKSIGQNMTKAYQVISKSDVADRAKLLDTVSTKYTGQQILEAARKYEVLGTSTHLGDLGGDGTSSVVNNSLFRWGRKRGTMYVEEPARLALFMDQLKQGKTLEQAAIRVKNVLFDYAELTKTEKNIRDYGLVPFYTWMRKNIPLQIESAARHPERMEAVGNLIDVPWNANNNMEGVVVPEERQNAGYVPFNASTEGNLPAMVRWALPSYDINKLGDPGSFIADSMGPLPKLVYEYSTGTKMNHAPIKSRTGFSRPSGLANTLGRVLNGVIPDGGKGYMTPIDVGGRPMQLDQWSWLTGVIPTGPLGSTLQGDDPLNPRWNSGVAETAARILGLTPDVLSPNDQKYEAIARKTDLRRDAIRKLVLEQ